MGHPQPLFFGLKSLSRQCSHQEPARAPMPLLSCFLSSVLTFVDTCVWWKGLAPTSPFVAQLDVGWPCIAAVVLSPIPATPRGPNSPPSSMGSPQNHVFPPGDRGPNCCPTFPAHLVLRYWDHTRRMSCKCFLTVWLNYSNTFNVLKDSHPRSILKGK